VISHTSVERYKKTQRPLLEIARELGVDAVVEGTVMCSNRRVRISAQLIDAHSDQHLWAESYERDLGDALALQGEVAQRIAAEVGANLTAGERALLTETQHVDPAGQEAYLKGKFFWNKLNCTGFKKAIEYYQAAIGTDPNFAPAYFGLADSYFNLADWGCAPQDEAFRKSEAAALKAVELDPNLASAHASLGELAFYHEWNWGRAEREFGRALELDSNDSSTHATYAVFLLAMGKREQGLAEIKRARQLDPVSELTNVQAIYVLYLAREHDEAIALAKKTLELYPDSTACYYWLGQLYEIEGRPEESLAAYLKAWSGNPVLIEAARKGGLKAYWLKQLSVSLDNKPATACWKGMAYAHVGEKEGAISLLERGFRDHCDGLQFLNADPAYDGLRGDPRFKDLIGRLHL
jgi:tetratricopeptide (TPR) repeat protein